MINKEAIELLEKVNANLWDYTSPNVVITNKHIADSRKLIDQALALLKEQPPASEFTVEMRLTYELRPKVIEGKIAAKHIFDLCDRLDVSEASRKELLAACEAAFNESHNPEVEKILEAAIKANK